MHEITSSCLGQRKSNGYRKQSHSSHQNPCARLMLIAVHATRCQYSASQDVGMAECQDSSQLRVTYITNDCGSVEQEQRWVRERERERGGERERERWSSKEENGDAMVSSVARVPARARKICWWSDAPGVASFVKSSICRSRGSITIF